MVALSACSSGEVVSSNKTFRAPISVPAGNISNWKVNAVRVVIPETMTVSSDPKVRKPRDQIVWWGEAAGDRKVQVSRILENAVRQGASGLRGKRGVNIDVQLAMFHALTPKARANKLAGRHDLKFTLVVRDAATGTMLAQSGMIDASINAFQGQDAVEAVARGETQKVRITRRITSVVNAWLNSNGVVVAAKAKPAPRKQASRAAVAPTPVKTEKVETPAEQQKVKSEVVAVANASSGTSGAASKCVSVGVAANTAALPGNC